MTPDNQAPKPELIQEHPDNIKNSLYTEKTELQRLEDDLKYTTGKSDRLEVQKKIKNLKKEVGNSPEKKMMDGENKKNYIPGMSFNSEQEIYIKDKSTHYTKNKQFAEIRQIDDMKYVDGKIKYLRGLEARLLEAKVRAKTKILGGKDTTETLPIEKEILQVKSDIALGVTMAASTYLGLSIDKSDMGL